MTGAVALGSDGGEIYVSPNRTLVRRICLSFGMSHSGYGCTLLGAGRGALMHQAKN